MVVEKASTIVFFIYAAISSFGCYLQVNTLDAYLFNHSTYHGHQTVSSFLAILNSTLNGSNEASVELQIVNSDRKK